LTWLSRHLKMPYVYGPTTGPLWGNAILSRYPIVKHTQHQLPSKNQSLSRGIISASIDIGDSTQLQFIVVHFHGRIAGDIEGDADIRLLQSKTLIDFWRGSKLTAILGDFNAQFNDIEIAVLRDAGLVDAAATQDAPLLTWPSDNPRKRLDYIWLSPDLRTMNVQVSRTIASDHLPIIAVIDR